MRTPIALGEGAVHPYKSNLDSKAVKQNSLAYRRTRPENPDALNC